MRWVHSGDLIHKNVTVVKNFKGVKVFLLYPSKLFERKWKCSSLSCVQLFVTPRTVACQASLSMEFSRQESWSGLPFPAPGDLPDTGIKYVSLMCLALAGGFFTTLPSGKPGHIKLKSILKNSTVLSFSLHWKKGICLLTILWISNLG